MRRTGLSATICFSVVLLFSLLSFGDTSSVTAILGALDAEIALLEDNLTGREESAIEGIRFITGEMKGRSIVLARTGVGKVNAAMIATLLIEHFRPSEVIFTGVAGGINPDLRPGDIVIAAKTVQHDLGMLSPDGFENWGVKNPVSGERNPTFFPADPRLLTLAEMSAKYVSLEKFTTKMPEIIKGVVVTGDMFVASSAKKKELRKDLQADAVEMEGAAVAQICWQQDVPCLVIRSLSDSADEHARLDFEDFYKIAARNSAQLVTELIGRLDSDQ